MRAEKEIFNELAALCLSPGFIHAVAWFCVRDNFVIYEGDIKPEDLSHLFTHDRLIATEISTLIGLMQKGEIDFDLPETEVFQEYCSAAERLLEELHHALIGPMKAAVNPDAVTAENGVDANQFIQGMEFDMREPIFYGGESAYSFQYRDLAPAKYAKDIDWLQANKGFAMEEARAVAMAILSIHNEAGVVAYKALRETQSYAPLLAAFEFTLPEVVIRSGLSTEIVSRILEAFSLPSAAANPTFASLNDFNGANAAPIIRRADSYVLFQYHSLVAAFYETPVYWMTADKSYKTKAFAHKGEFAETFAHDRLASVFGAENVYLNVHIPGAKGETLGEIDVLVAFAGVAIVVQAKTRRLSLEARKGNGLQIEADFKAAVQDSYNQALDCARHLLNPDTKLLDAEKKPLKLPSAVTTAFPICLVADHYPALAFQARQFLKVETEPQIYPPLVIDVFALDAIAEFLASPLRFLSYLKLRARFGEKLTYSHEFTLLSDHIKRNLWVDDEYDMVMMDDDVSADLEATLMVRREGLPGKRTPDGILTRFTESPVGHLLQAIEEQPQPDVIDLGFLLLEMNEKSTSTLSLAISRIVAATRKDGKPHDAGVALGEAASGLTLYCLTQFGKAEADRLRAHCMIRKYSQKAATWYGLAFDPDGNLRVGLKLTDPWQYDPQIEAAVAAWKGNPVTPQQFHQHNLKDVKVGVNEPCPCGSGRKFKKCCR